MANSWWWLRPTGSTSWRSRRRAAAAILFLHDGVGYFADAAALLAPGDMVMLPAAAGGKIATVAGTGKGIVLAPLV